MTNDEKLGVLADLLQVYAQAINLENVLWLKGDPAAANTAEMRANRIGQQINALRADLWGSWQGQANVVRQQFITQHQGVSSAIAEIQNNISTAQTVVNAIGYLDTVINIVAGILV